ncbi:MAG: NUDIX hydrolase [Calditrichaeota bacterium]|nr:NUDIX hydrolase [Calditrichota bacterium]
MGSLIKLNVSDVENSELFSPLLLDGELADLKDKFGKLVIYKTTVELVEEHFQYWHDLTTKRRDRRGEVALVIENEKNQVLLHTKDHYPTGAFRIPTGGINYNEKVIDALHRETFEETGFSLVSYKFIALLLYEFEYLGQKNPFMSFIFHVTPDGVKPQVQDENEKISGFRWINRREMGEIAQELRNLPDAWKEWGIMRAIPHELVHDL